MSDLADRLYEQVLVLRCQAGDEAAFAELVESYQARLRYYVRKLLGSDTGGEDLVQEIWLEVFRSLPRLAKPAAFPAWFYRLARNRAYRQLRLRPSHGPLHEITEAAESDEPEFTAEDAERVHSALDQLPPEQREVLVLRFLEDMSYEDMVRVIGCPIGTVRSRIHYAKAALRRIMERINVYE